MWLQGGSSSSERVRGADAAAAQAADLRRSGGQTPDDLNRFRSVVFIKRGSVQPWSFGSGQGVSCVIPTGVFRTSDIEQMRMGVLEHLGIAQAPAWLFAAELREGTVIRLLTAFERTVPILAVHPAGRRMSPKFAFSSSIWRRLSRSVPSSIHPAKTMAE